MIQLDQVMTKSFAMPLTKKIAYSPEPFCMFRMFFFVWM